MKKFMLLAALVAAVTTTGCFAQMPVVDGFPTVPTGFIYADVTNASKVEVDGASVRKFEVVKEGVTSKVIGNSYLSLVSVGDMSFDKAKKEMLAQAAGANDIINIQVDTKRTNILGIIFTVENTFTGTAIKWNK